MNEIEVRFISYLQHDTKYIDRVQGKITALHLPHVYNVYRIINAYYKNHKSIIQEDYAIDFLKSHNYDNSILMNYQETMVAICKYTHFDDAEFEEILLQLENKFKKSSLMNCLEEILDKLGKNNTIEETDSCIAYLRNTLSTIESEFQYTTYIYIDNKGKAVVDYVGLCSALIKNLKIVKINGQLYNFNRYIKKYSSYEGENILIGELGNAFQQISTSKLNKLIPTQIHQETQEIDGKYIAFKNVLYNAMSGEVKPRTPDDVILNVIDFDLPDLNTYQPRKEVAETVDKIFLNWSDGDKNIADLLYQIIGTCISRLQPKGEYAKLFFLTGLGNNGKSQYLNWINAILNSNVSHSPLADLLDDKKFNKIAIENKTANIIDDATNAVLKDASKIKSLATGTGSIVGSKKYQDEHEITNKHLTIVIGCNQVCLMGNERDKESIPRRIIIIPFNKKFDSKNNNLTPQEEDILFHPENYPDYMIYVILKALKCYYNVLSNKAYITTPAIQNLIQEYKEQLDPISEFISNLAKEDVLNKTILEVTQMYYQSEGITKDPTKSDKTQVSKAVRQKFNDIDVKPVKVNNVVSKRFVLKV